MTDDMAQENTELLRKRLRYRSWHRGIKEMDILLGQFADQFLAEMDDAALDVYENLISHNDQELYAWMTGRKPVPTQIDHELFRRIAAAHHVQL